MSRPPPQYMLRVLYTRAVFRPIILPGHLFQDVPLEDETFKLTPQCCSTDTLTDAGQETHEQFPHPVLKA